jgi:hypothetical protein
MPLPDFTSFYPGYEEEIKEAERRKTLFRNLRSLAGCGTAPTFILPRVRGRTQEGAARLPAFHRGSCQRDSCIPTAQLGPGFAGQAPLSGGGIPPGAGPGCSEHLACRS